MSPEQAMGESDPDGRSDVYSLGCVLFDMLTGGAPFTGSTPQALITKRFTDPVPSVRATRTEVTGELELVVTKSLAREPAERFDSAALVAQALGSPKMITPPYAVAVAAPASHSTKSIRGDPVRRHEPPARPGVLL